MFVPIRKTNSGTEYWDNKEKRTLFVPTGEEPNFEVTENPKSMIGDNDTDLYRKKHLNNSNEPDLNSMKIQELKDYAEGHAIKIPSDITKKDDIIKFLSDAE